VTVSTARDTGQLLLGGQGSLHLEIVRDRLATHYGVPITAGPIYIAYRCAPTRSVRECTLSRDVRVSGVGYRIVVCVTLQRVDVDDDEAVSSSSVIEVPKSALAAVREAIETGAHAALDQVCAVLCAVCLVNTMLRVHRALLQASH
jgi:translation elongation factor EF-G